MIFTPEDIVVTRRGARFLGRTFPVSVGRGGIVPGRRKREGDGATPAGVHRIAGCLYRADRLAAPCDWALPIGPFDLWSDDPRDPDYNLPVAPPHRFSHERMHRADPRYDIVLPTDWNWPEGVPHHGSAIFVHAWRGPGHPTAGCVAFAPAALRWIVPRIRLHSRLIVVG